MAASPLLSSVGQVLMSQVVPLVMLYGPLLALALGVSAGYVVSGVAAIVTVLKLDTMEECQTFLFMATATVLAFVGMGTLDCDAVPPATECKCEVVPPALACDCGPLALPAAQCRDGVWAMAALLVLMAALLAARVRDLVAEKEEKAEEAAAAAADAADAAEAAARKTESSA